jgi:hypothetical protein
MNPHLHEYKLDSSVGNGHRHRIRGYTDSMIGINILHFHYFFGVSSYNNHTHYFSGFTGLPVKTENGHIHKIEGILELNNLHEHSLEGYTFEETAYIPRRRKVDEVFI